MLLNLQGQGLDTLEQKGLLNLSMVSTVLLLINGVWTGWLASASLTWGAMPQTNQFLHQRDGLGSFESMDNLGKEKEVISTRKRKIRRL